MLRNVPGIFYICNANSFIPIMFDNTGVRSDMRPGFSIWVRNAPNSRFLFKVDKLYIPSEKVA